MQAMWRSLKPVSTFFRRARFFSKLVLTGKARYACYLMEMRLRGVDLGWQSTHDLGLAKERAHDHADSGGPELASLLRQIRLRPGCTILDLGCGKGGAMITFARSGFKRVDGIELSPELCRVARRNLGLLGLSDVHVIECDAANFVDFDGYDVVYMFNPFPEKIVSEVVSNLAVSLAGAPRSITLIYRNPVCDRAILNGPFERRRELTVGQHVVYIYQTSPEMSAPEQQRACS